MTRAGISPCPSSSLTLAVPAGVALAAALLVDHGCLAAFGAQVADLEEGLLGGCLLGGDGGDSGWRAVSASMLLPFVPEAV